MKYDESDDINYQYYEVQSIFLDHPLTLKEIEYYKDLIFSPNGLKQIYFSNNIDIKSIEIIKNLLIISDYTDDIEIEKIVLVNFNKKELKQFLNINYLNPFTWKVPIENNANTLILAELPNYRKLYSFIEQLKDNKLSPLEQLTKIYDRVKLINFNNDNKNNTLFEIIDKNSANSYGFNKLFSYILEFLGYKTYIGKAKDSNQTNYLTLVEIKDKKYQIEGIYIFDPSMDTLPKEEYKSEEIRRTNYNFFGLNLLTINELVFDTKLLGVLEILSSKDYNHSENRITNTKNKELLSETRKVLSVFGLSFKKLYNVINKTKSISSLTIIKINNVLYEKEDIEKEKRNKFILDNYVERNKELFNPTINEIIEEFS